METVVEMFDSYLKTAYPRQKIEGTQLQEVRRSFYAGVAGGISVNAYGLMRAELIEQWIAELDRFKEQVKKGEM
jgi:glycerate kinase